jgi:hypothetical protein
MKRWQELLSELHTEGLLHLLMLLPVMAVPMEIVVEPRAAGQLLVPSVVLLLEGVRLVAHTATALQMQLPGGIFSSSSSNTTTWLLDTQQLAPAAAAADPLAAAPVAGVVVVVQCGLTAAWHSNVCFNMA